ncbi:MAG: virulence factor TspB C-terminal domain-related protein [Candidatus Saccharibacteria bacterium]|nr:virulence factor TspB C-terminal domain-related protein [Candidatus Saccharibacteria bacterium]
MDIIKLIFVLYSLLFFASSNAAVFDMGEHSGIIRDSNGNFSQVSANGSVRSLTSNTALSIAEKVNFQTSKGVFSTDIVRTALVDTARIGKTVRGLAVAGGPIGLTVTAVSLVCELTSICNDAGQWMLGADPALEGYPQTLESQAFYFVAGINSPEYRWPSPSIACSQAAAVAKFWGDGFTGTGSGTGATACVVTNTNNNTTNNTSITQGVGCPTSYVISGSTCVLQGQSTAQPATPSDWDSKEALLNDSRFTPELHAKDQPIPVQTPSLPSPVTVPIGNTTKTLKDGSGNVTGTESEITEAKIEQPSQGENPTGNPNILKLTETTINNTYNTNNQLTSSTTTTNTGPQQPQPQSFEIEIDNMVDQPLEQQAVPGTFSYTSWGSGSCPADRSVNYHYGTLTLTFEPACDLAVMANPVVIAIAGLAALFIVSGAVRND